VLLVDDHGPERREIDALLDQRVGADHDVDLTAGQAGQDPAPIGCPDPVGEQLDPDRAGAEERRARIRHLDPVQQGPDPRRVLLGQHLGGRHERALVPALDCGQQRPHRHHGLARAHVALQQAVHRVGCGQVGPDLGDGGLLVVGERERQPGHELVEQGPRGHLRDAPGGALDVALALDQGELDPQQLVQHEAASGHLLVGHGLRGVDAGDRLAPGHQVVAVEHPLRDRVGQAAGLRAAQRLLDPGPDLPGRQPGLLRLRVDGHDPPGPAADQVDDRVGHLAAPAVHVDLAEQRHGRARAQLALPPRLVEERHPQPAGLVADLGGDQRPGRASLGPAGRHPVHRHQDERLLPHLQVPDPALVGAIDVAAGVIGQQVGQVLDPDRRQPLGLAVTDPLQPGHRPRGQLAERDRPVGHAYSTPNRYG
jgi:hypothetical protein